MPILHSPRSHLLRATLRETHRRLTTHSVIFVYNSVDEYSSNNARLMFPMNFSLPATHQYQQAYHQNQGTNGVGYPAYQYQNVYYQPQP